jgi:hypothetical protein
MITTSPPSSRKNTTLEQVVTPEQQYKNNTLIYPPKGPDLSSSVQAARTNFFEKLAGKVTPSDETYDKYFDWNIGFAGRMFKALFGSDESPKTPNNVGGNNNVASQTSDSSPKEKANWFNSLRNKFSNK